MKTCLLWRRFLIGCVLLALLTGCAKTAPKPPAPEPTVIPTSIPRDTPEPTVTPLPFVEGTEFPTGTFESASGVVAVEFREDGRCRWYSVEEGWEVPCKYAVSGNLFSEMTFEWPSGPQVPATYYWTFDGEKLIFQLWGNDLRPHRKSVYDGQTYLFSGETDASPKAEGAEFPTGTFVSANRNEAVEFNEDGTCRWYSDTWEVPCKYGVNGDLFTEMTFEWPTGPQVPATYYWTYDGENLTFEVWGEDIRQSRRVSYDGQTLVKAE